MEKRKSILAGLIQILGLSILGMLKRFGRGRPDTNKNSRTMDTTSVAELSIPGPLVTDVFDHIKKMPGWSSVDDCSHFSLIISLQSNLGITGDLFEIGSYHGRSTALLAFCLKEGEKLVVCDAFEKETPDPYENRPSRSALLENIKRVNPNLGTSNIEIHYSMSHELQLERSARFRFIHIDGGHSKEEVLGDLLLCKDHLCPGGVIALDDYMHPEFPGVAQAISEFLSVHNGFIILADLNRHGMIGRKLYLIKRDSIFPLKNENV